MELGTYNKDDGSVPREIADWSAESVAVEGGV